MPLTSYEKEELRRIRETINRLLDNKLSVETFSGGEGKKFEELCLSYGYSVQEIRSYDKYSALAKARARVVKDLYKEGFTIALICKLINRGWHNVAYLVKEAKV